VYKGTWRGTEVAVKRILETAITPPLLAEFVAEVELMARLRHPNIVLFMGAVMQVGGRRR
jgi:serine/threonine protein kinase